MVTASSSDAQLNRLAELVENGRSDSAVKELKALIAGANLYVAAKAANAAVKLGLTELSSNVADALTRALGKPAKDDKGCIAKTLLAESLDSLGYADDSLFLRGARQVQMESTYGGVADTAAALRARCATALVRTGKTAEVLRVLTDLLVDREPGPRVVAAKNLAFAITTDASELLLRLKIHIGDDNAEVLENCFAGLLNMAPDRYYDFVASRVAGADLGVGSAAASALATSRDRERAFTILQKHWERDINSAFREMLIVPMALTRCQIAFDFLVGLAADANPKQAVLAVRALSCFPVTPEQVGRIREAVVDRKDAPLTEEFRQHFGQL